MRNNILFFCPSIEEGGVEKNLYIIANSLSKNNNIFILTANRNKRNKFKKKIKFISPKSDFWSNKSRIIKVLICLKLLLFNFKINNYTAISFQANVVAIIVFKLFRKKIIIRCNTSPSSYIFNPLFKLFFAFFYNLADKIIVNSLDFKREFYIFFKIKANLIYNPAIRSLHNNLNFSTNYLKDKKIKIICVGRLTRIKNQIIILKALNLIKDKINFQLTILGKGSELNNLRKFVNCNDLNNMVNFKGYIKDVDKFINKSDVLIHSAQFEGLPNVLIEAQFRKKLIISSDCPTGPSEILMRGNGGYLFKSNNYKHLSKILLKLKKEEKIIRSMIKISFMNLGRFDSKKNCNEYERIIKN